MRAVFGIALIGMVCVFLSGCGKTTAGNTTDTGQSLSGIVGTAFTGANTPATRAAQSANEEMMTVAKKIAGKFQREIDRGTIDACTAFDGLAGADENYTVSWTCTSNTVSIAVTTKIDKTFSCTAAGGRTDYVLKSGSRVSLALSVVDVASDSASVALSFNSTVTGGGFKASGSTITGGFTVSRSDVAKFASSSYCSSVTHFTLSVDGTALTCSDLESHPATCA